MSPFNPDNSSNSLPPIGNRVQGTLHLHETPISVSLAISIGYIEPDSPQGQYARAKIR